MGIEKFFAWFKKKPSMHSSPNLPELDSSETSYTSFERMVLAIPNLPALNSVNFDRAARKQQKIKDKNNLELNPNSPKFVKNGDYIESDYQVPAYKSQF